MRAAATTAIVRHFPIFVINTAKSDKNITMDEERRPVNQDNYMPLWITCLVAGRSV
jgi:hypothetical protein